VEPGSRGRDSKILGLPQEGKPRRAPNDVACIASFTPAEFGPPKLNARASGVAPSKASTRPAQRPRARAPATLTNSI
jgi:hypothetical protein